MKLLKEIVTSDTRQTIPHELEKILKDHHKTYFVSGSNQMKIALYASYLISGGYRTVLFPKEQIDNTEFTFSEEYDLNGVSIYTSEIAGDWLSGMFTSGSTSNPKLIVHTASQIATTLSWYKKIYDITEDSLIITAMPATYNFTFIAGILNCCNVGSTFGYLKPTELLEYISKNSSRFDKTIVLANPVVLDMMSDLCDKNRVTDAARVFIDSGGAPISSYAIRWFRERGFTIREGYGLTETCSLNHFDIEGNEDSIGSVGFELNGVKSEIIHKDGRNVLKILSPNAGKVIASNGCILEDYSEGILTTDIAKIENGRLTLLGRVPDFCINNHWPKDTLELIGEVIGPKCALIQHTSENSVAITLWDHSLLCEEKRILQAVSSNLNIDNITISANTAPLLHSLKLRRKK